MICADFYNLFDKLLGIFSRASDLVQGHFDELLFAVLVLVFTGLAVNLIKGVIGAFL